MNKSPIETLKIIGQGAIGAMTFGAYHMVVTIKMMELNNEKMEIQHKTEMDRQNNEHKKQMDELRQEIKDTRWF